MEETPASDDGSRLEAKYAASVNGQHLEDIVKSNGTHMPEEDDTGFWFRWREMSIAGKVMCIWELPAVDWYEPECLNLLAVIRENDPVLWGKTTARWTSQLYQKMSRLEGAINEQLKIVEGERAISEAESLIARPPDISAPAVVTSKPIIPFLPQGAVLDPEAHLGAAPWLESYIAHSKYWSPLAAAGFHEACGLWVLSTVAARRISVYLTRPYYPALFMALVAPSSLYAKTTTAYIAQTAIQDVGLSCLLAPDRATPQALHRFMSGIVPAIYDDLDDDDKTRIKARLRFAAQVGWYYEEWGSMLHQMNRRDSPMAEFHGNLRALDDGKDEWRSTTIQRGEEKTVGASMALLASATPADLAQFMKPGSPWWRDGFFPRFSFVVPLPEEPRSPVPFPKGLQKLHSSLIVDLMDWHARLGIPTIEIAPHDGKTGKTSPAWSVTRSPLPLQEITFDAKADHAQEAYQMAIFTMIADTTQVSEDLGASYIRLHAKAIRIAMLLASVEGKTVIGLQHWAYAQAITERWRRMMHQVIEMAADSQPLTRDILLQEKVESLLARHHPLSLRGMHQHLRRIASMRELRAVVKDMVDFQAVIEQQHGKTTMYMLPMNTYKTSDEGHNKEEKIEW